MVRTCIVCKKEYASYDKSRSFHKFPKNDELKNKWMQAIGVSTVPKTTVICSDHFDTKAFTDLCGYTVVRRLLPNTVPLSKDLDQLDTIKSEPCEIEFVTVGNCANTTSTLNTNNPSNDYINVATESVDNYNKNQTSVDTEIKRILPNNVLDQLDTIKSEPCEIEFVTVGNCANTTSTLNTNNSSNDDITVATESFDNDNKNQTSVDTEIKRILPNNVLDELDTIKSEPCEIEFVTVGNCANTTSTLNTNNSSNDDINVATESVDNDNKNQTNIHTTEVKWILPNTVPQNNLLGQVHTIKSAPCKIVYSTIHSLNTNKSSDLLENTESKNSLNKNLTVTPESIKNDTKNQKRELSITNIKQKKKFRFMNGFKTEYVKREDFVSEEAWERFLRFNAYKNLRISRSKYYRNSKKKFDLRDLICVLKSKEMFDTAQYFMDLPQHVLERVIKLKNKKKTAPFPEKLKDFASTIYFQSPAAYEFIRSNFIKCLPCVESLGLENSSEIIEMVESKTLVRQNEHLKIKKEN